MNGKKRNINIQVELIYALAVVLSLVLCFAKKKGLITFLDGAICKSSDGEESCEQKLADAAVFAIKGRRPSMEDRFSMVQVPIPHLANAPVVRIFAVLDGHGGQYAPIYVKKHLLANLTAKIKVLKLLANKSKVQKTTLIKTIDKLLPGSMSKSILEYVGLPLNEYKSINPDSDLFKNETTENNNKPDGLVVMTNRIKTLEELPVKPKRKNDKIDSNDISGHAHSELLSPYSNVPRKSASKSPRRQDSESEKTCPKELIDYLNAKNEILYSQLISDEISKIDDALIKAAKKDRQAGGTTLLLAILDDSTLWVANVGDCRGVLKSANGEVVPLSFDHKPNQIKEKNRIEQAGGFVSLIGVWRVNGVLAVSRALGDYPLKDQKVIVSEPDVLSFQLDSPEFAILASDGLWDTHTNEMAVNNVETSLKASDSMLNAAKTLARDAFKRGSTDNVSVMVINLKNMMKNK